MKLKQRLEYIDRLEFGLEIDELIATEVMGWHKDVSKPPFIQWHDTNGYKFGVAKYDCFEDDEDIHLLTWSPSRSILQAFELAERFKISIVPPGGWVNGDFIDSDSLWKVENDITEAYASMPELAICRCVLKTSFILEKEKKRK